MNNAAEPRLDKKPMRPLLTFVALILLTLLFVGCSENSADVSVIGISEPFDDAILEAEAGAISYKEALVSGNETYRLLPTYDNRDAALSNVRDEVSPLLSYLQKYYLIPVPFSDVSWQLYRDANDSIRDENNRTNWSPSLSKQSNRLKSFFDIYENEAENKRIIDIAFKEGIDAVSLMLPENANTQHDNGKEKPT